MMAGCSNCEDGDHEAFLTTVDGSMEAEIIEGLLNSNGIPVLKKYRGTGGYMTVFAGRALFGVDLFVPSRLLDKAKELLESRNEGKVSEEDMLDTAGDEVEDNTRQMSRTILLILLAFIIIAFIFKTI